MKGITVTGTGTVTVVPDRARLAVGVQVQGETASAALAQLAERIGALRAALDLPDAAVRTGYTSLGPRHDERGMPVPGFQANSQLILIVDPVDRAGAVLDAAVAAGATGIDDLSLLVADPRPAYDVALRSALGDARAKAELIAAGIGMVAGRIRGVVEGFAGGATPVAYAARSEGMLKSMPVEPGTTDVVATVTVRFALASAVTPPD